MKKILLLTFILFGFFASYTTSAQVASGFSDTIINDRSASMDNEPSVSGKDEVIIYPNPANNEVNVVFNPNAGIKNIAVYNLIGRALNIYHVGGNSARLDIEGIPSGIYFVRLLGAQGDIIATRKFTRQ